MANGMRISDIKATCGGEFTIGDTGETLREYFAEATIEDGENTWYVSIYDGGDEAQYVVADVSLYGCFTGDTEPYGEDAFDEMYTSMDEATESEFVEVFRVLDGVLKVLG